MRSFAFLLVLLAALIQATGAFAHASLVRAEPADGEMLAQAPAALTLTFNEPVSPLVMRLLGPGGEAIAPTIAADNAVIKLTVPQLRQGTHVLSWRVVSADGHPVGGSLIFSVGAPSPGTVPASQGSTSVRTALWAAKVAIYVGLFFGVGGAFFRSWIGGAGGVDRWLNLALAVAVVAIPLSVCLQGLDALDLPFAGLANPIAWQTGVQTAYGLTAIAAAMALCAGIFALKTPATHAGRILSLVGLAGAGLALSLSGHAGTVEPQWLMRSVVFLHGVCVAFWVGAFLPLIVAVRGGDTRALARFSKIIPLPLVVIVFTGLKLAFTQLDRFDALWTTTYGLALSGKLAAVIGLFALGAANRYALVPAFQRASMVAQPLLRSMKVELVLALAILALVASWRFTPPPRALAAAHVSVHLHSAKAMAQIDIDPERARGAHVEIQVLNGEMGPLAAKEVALVLANPAAGIEPVRRNAQGAGADWRIDDLRIPVAGRWRMRVEILINDFEKAVVEDEVTLPRLP